MITCYYQDEECAAESIEAKYCDEKDLYTSAAGDNQFTNHN